MAMAVMNLYYEAAMYQLAFNAVSESSLFLRLASESFETVRARATASRIFGLLTTLHDRNT